MTSHVEHVQYVCSNLDAMVGFYAHVFEWRLRGRGTEGGPLGYDWVHIGTDESYVAFRTPYNGGAYADEAARRMDHVGIVVDDWGGFVARLEGLGWPYTVKGSHPFRRRLYLRDPDGNEIEVIAYSSGDPRQRNDYEIDRRKARG